jgi:SAM-dependent methyltransferase
MKVLHVGCGDGTDTFAIAAHTGDGSVVGVDANATLVRDARKKSTWQRQEGVSFEAATLTKLRFEDGEFDAALASGPLEQLADPQLALAEISRVLRPGGMLGARHAVASSRVVNFNLASIERAAQQALADLRESGGDPDFGLRQPSLMREAGFINLRVTTSTDQMGADELMAAFWPQEKVEAAGLTEEQVDQLNEETRGSGLFSAVVAVETIGWKPAK